MARYGRRMKRKSLVVDVILIFIICGMWALTPTVVARASSSYITNASAQACQFGDLFGRVNALFSGLAFGGVALTLYLQREEIEANTRLAAVTAALNVMPSLIKAEQENISVKRTSVNWRCRT